MMTHVNHLTTDVLHRNCLNKRLRHSVPFGSTLGAFDSARVTQSQQATTAAKATATAQQPARQCLPTTLGANNNDNDNNSNSNSRLGSSRAMMMMM